MAWRAACPCELPSTRYPNPPAPAGGCCLPACLSLSGNLHNRSLRATLVSFCGWPRKRCVRFHASRVEHRASGSLPCFAGEGVRRFNDQRGSRRSNHNLQADVRRGSRGIGHNAGVAQFPDSFRQAASAPWWHGQRDGDMSALITSGLRALRAAADPTYDLFPPLPQLPRPLKQPSETYAPEIRVRARDPGGGAQGSARRRRGS